MAANNFGIDSANRLRADLGSERKTEAHQCGSCSSKVGLEPSRHSLADVLGLPSLDFMNIMWCHKSLYLPKRLKGKRRRASCFGRASTRLGSLPPMASGYDRGSRRTSILSLGSRLPVRSPVDRSSSPIARSNAEARSRLRSGPGWCPGRAQTRWRWRVWCRLKRPSASRSSRIRRSSCA